MKNFYIFTDALEFIEDNLREDISQQDIADACCCSLSGLQKIWRYCSHMSIKEYISKRRLSAAAKELLEGDSAIIDIALRYQYNSPEVFSRAFSRMWGLTPSKFRESRKNAGFFPRMIADSAYTGGKHMGRKVDISELYEFLRSKKDSYVICFDVRNLMPVNNNYGSEAGDLVIREAFRRIDEAAGDDMAAFRIGGDEFAVITGLTTPEEAEALAEKVLSQNGTPIRFKETDIPVSLRSGAFRYKASNYCYDELFGRLRDTINIANDTDKLTFSD